MGNKRTPWLRPNWWISPTGAKGNIKFVTKLVDGKTKAPLFGLINTPPEPPDIWIRTGLDPRFPGTPPPSNSELAGTLIHEMYHGLYPEEEEPFIERAEFLLSATIRRNKKVWYWILENL